MSDRGDTLYHYGKSHSSWVRGLKSGYLMAGWQYSDVALFMGAWIEIAGSDILKQICLVALFMGAWIEM